MLSCDCFSYALALHQSPPKVLSRKLIARVRSVVFQTQKQGQVHSKSGAKKEWSPRGRVVSVGWTSGDARRGLRCARIRVHGLNISRCLFPYLSRSSFIGWALTGFKMAMLRVFVHRLDTTGFAMAMLMCFVHGIDTRTASRGNKDAAA